MIINYIEYIKEKSEFNKIHPNLGLISNYLKYIVKKLNIENGKFFDYDEDMNRDVMRIYFNNDLCIDIVPNYISGKLYINNVMNIDIEDITADNISINYNYLDNKSIKLFKENLIYIIDNYYRLLETSNDYKTLTKYRSLSMIPVFDKQKYNIFMFDLFKKDNFKNLKRMYDTLWLNDELIIMLQPYMNAINFDLL